MAAHGSLLNEMTDFVLEEKGDPRTGDKIKANCQDQNK